MTFRKPALLIVPFLLLQLLSAAQTRITIKTLDSRSLQPVPSATIGVYPENNDTNPYNQLSDSAGSLSLNNVPTGKYKLEISAIGYSSFSKPIILTNQPFLDTIFLDPEAKLLGEVSVSSARPAFQRKGDRLILPVSGNQFFKTAANGYDILKKIPGLSVAGDGSLLMDGRVAPGIFVDGKPMPISPEELQNYLGSLNPEMIASIELISNPSSRYDGEYKAIIDIKLKRDMDLGWKGNISSTITRNDFTLAEQNLLLTYKTKKIAYTLRGGYTNGTRNYRYRARQILSDNNILSTRTKTPTYNNNINYQLGADYSITKQHRLEIVLRHYITDRDVNSLNRLFATDPSGSGTTLNTHTYNNSSPKQNNYGANLNYSGSLKKTDIQLLGTYLNISNRQNEDIQNRNTVNNDLLSHWKTTLKNDITIRTAQLDLSRETLAGRFSLGGKFAFTTTRNDLRYDTLNNSQTFILDSGRTNNFAYDEYISAGYASYERTKSKLSYALSIRAEHTHSVANSVTTENITTRNYLNWLPSASLTYTHNRHQYHLSYSRRITRPTFTQLNPFRFYLSPLNYHVGNPLLLPSKTSSINLAYSFKTLSLRISGGKETDPLSRYPEYNDTTHILEYLGRNLPYNHFLTIEGSYALSITKWWKTNNTLNILYKKELTPYHDKTYSLGIWEYMITGSQVFTLPKGINADISYKYQSPGGNGLYKTKSYLYIDLGLQKTWLNGRLNTRLNYYDIFDQFEVQYIFREKQLINNQLAHWFGTSRVTATIIFSFGKSTYKTKQGNRVEEEGRTGLQQ
ncbi:MAG: TonB-dependent receptor [Citrobacter freundii]|nr:MAG: TonB-dependent receptor [Citrobacter freundii]